MSNEFLSKLIEVGKKYSGGGGAGIIGRVKVEVGLHRYVSGHDFWAFWKPVAEVSEEEIERVAVELRGRMRMAGSNDAPNFGLKITIDKNVLSRDEPYKADLQEFIPSWQEDAYNMVIDHIDQGGLPLGEWFYGHVQYKANPYSVKKGDAGKTDTDQEGNPRFPTIRVPVEKYADEATARAAVGGGSSTGQADSNSKWSDTLKANYPDPSLFEKNTSDIQAAWTKISAGELPWTGAAELPKPPTPPNLKQYLADLYSCESQDIDVALNEIPF